MPRSFRVALPALVIALTTAAPAPAALIFFNNRPAFEAAAPGLPVETFENNVRPDGQIFQFPEPLNSASNNGSFLPGSILPGVDIGALGATPVDLTLLTQGLLGVPSDVVGPFLFAEDLELTFAAGVGAVGFDVLAALNGGTVTVSVFGPGNVLLGTQDLVLTPVPIFFGVVSSPEPITRITVTDTAAGVGELIDNLAFGPAAAVPEPASVGLLAAGAAVLAGFCRRAARN